MRLQGKMALITDADSESGQSLAKRLVAEGAGLLLNSASGGEQLAEVLDYIRSMSGSVRVVQVNLCSEQEVHDMLEDTLASSGRVDVLVHNQRRVMPLSVEAGDEAAFLEVLNTNAKSAFVCTKLVGRQMAEAQSGRVIYIGSIHADKPNGASFAFSVSQGAIQLLAREAALTLGRYGVTVNTIALGPMEGDDDLFGSGLSPLYENYRYKVPNGVLGSFDDLADGVLYLASEEARYVNGADLRMDGGFVLHYLDHKMKNATPQGGE